MSSNDDHHVPEHDPPARRQKPPDGADDASQTLRLGNGAIRISRQGIGISLQTGTLLTLLGFGWQAMKAMDDQLEEVERTRTEFDARHAEVENELREINGKLQSNVVGVEQVIGMKVEVSNLRANVTELQRKVDDLEDELRRVKP